MLLTKPGIRYTVLIVCVWMLTGTAFQRPPVKRGGKRPPNIIILLVDDAGYADFGFMGSKDLSTPNLDALARQSVRFTDAHVTASVCSPSRAGLITGKYQQRFGYECNEGEGYTGMDSTQLTLASLLSAQGYATAAFGKWHLGFERSQHPLRKGFRYYYGFLSGSRSYFYRPDKDDKPGARNALLENDQPVPFEGYLTDVLAEKAAGYIRENRDKPFFMYWAPNAVHTPMEATKEDLERFKGHPRQLLAAMTYSLDRAVGTIIRELKEQGLLENTMIFFLSDNGGAHNNQSDNSPLKGFKGNEYEAGHRIPFLLSWPAVIRGQRSFPGLTSSLDILPTALDAAGISHSAAGTIDGVSLLPYLRGQKIRDPHPLLVWRKDKAAAIREGRYKLVYFEGVGERLYDLAKDPGESADLMAVKPVLGQLLKNQFREWETKMRKPLWTEGSLWDSITRMIHEDLMENRPVRVRNPEELKAYRQQQPTPQQP